MNFGWIGGGMAAAYGTSDYLAGRASRTVPPLVVLAVGRCVVLPVLAVAAPLSGDLTGAALGWGAVAGVPLFLGFAGLFAALGTGAMAVAAPTIALTAAGVPLVAGVALGAPVPPLAWVGAAAAGVALALLNLGPGEEGAPRGRAFRYAAGGGSCLGLFTVLVSRTDPDTGVWPLLAAQVVAGVLVGAVLAAARLRGRPGVVVPRGLVVLVLVAAVVELAGDVLGLVAARYNLALVGPALALQPATTVLLAWLVDRESIGRVQWCGLGAAAAAMVLLTASV